MTSPQTEIDADRFIPHIRLLDSIRHDDAKVKQLRADVIADDELQAIVNEYVNYGYDNDETTAYACFGCEYGPTPRTLTDDVGRRTVNPDYEPTSDICGQKCPFGLWKPSLEEDEIQGSQGCLLLGAFVDLFGIPLTPTTFPDFFSSRLRLLNAVPDILDRAQGRSQRKEAFHMSTHVLTPTQRVNEGHVWDDSTGAYVVHADGTYITADQVAATPQPQLPPTPPQPQVPPTPPQPQVPPVPPANTVTPGLPAPANPGALAAPSGPPSGVVPGMVAPGGVPAPGNVAAPPAAAVAPQTPPPIPGGAPAPGAVGAPPPIPGSATAPVDEGAALANEIDTFETAMTQSVVQFCSYLRTQHGVKGAKKTRTTKPAAGTAGGDTLVLAIDHAAHSSELLTKFKGWLAVNFSNDNGATLAFDKASFKANFYDAATEEDMKCMLHLAGKVYTGWGQSAFGKTAKMQLGRWFSDTYLKPAAAA